MVMELKFASPLSLEEMVLRRLTAYLGSGSDILAFFAEFGFHCTGDKAWQEFFEPKIKDKVVKLELPQSLKVKILDRVRLVGLYIKIWIDLQDYHMRLMRRISFPDSAKLHWTSKGSVDFRRTAEELVRCDALDVVLRYILACINCLEDEIPLLWEKLPEKERAYFCNEILNNEISSPSLCFCWPHILKGELSILDYLRRKSNRNLSSFNQWAFEESVKTYNKCAVEYFFQKLSPEERETSLMRSIADVLQNRCTCLSLHLVGCEIFFYLFLLVTPDQRLEIIQNHTSEVLVRCHDSPWSDVFFENTEHCWTILPSQRYDEIVSKMEHRYDLLNPYFPKFFREFYIQTPPDFKKYFFNSELEMTPARSFLCAFLNTGDSESIEAMFRYADAANRLQIVSNPAVFELFFRSTLEGKRPVVETCLRQLSGRNRRDLKEAFSQFLARIVSGNCIDRMFKFFFEFPDETDEIVETQETG